MQRKMGITIVLTQHSNRVLLTKTVAIWKTKTQNTWTIQAQAHLNLSLQKLRMSSKLEFNFLKTLSSHLKVSGWVKGNLTCFVEIALNFPQKAERVLFQLKEFIFCYSNTFWEVFKISPTVPNGLLLKNQGWVKATATRAIFSSRFFKIINKLWWLHARQTFLLPFLMHWQMPRLDFTLASHWLDNSSLCRVVNLKTGYTIDNFVDSSKNIKQIEIIAITFDDFCWLKNREEKITRVATA